MAALALPLLAAALIPTATASLTVLGTALTVGTLATVVSSVVGGLIDQAIFGGGQDQQGPRLDDLSVTAATYGAGLPMLEGQAVRVAGNVIWSTGLIETPHEEEVGGKGGKGSTVTTYSYHVDMAVGLADCADGHPIADLRRIWASGKLIFDAGEATSAFTPITDGFFAEASDGAQSNPYFLRFYQGTFTQAVDPTMEAELGVGNVPAYRGTAYVVLGRLQLADFGNSIPNLEFEIVPWASRTAGAAAARLAARAGVAVTGADLVPEPLRGYAVARPTAPRNALDQLGLVFGFDAGEVAGAIRLVPRAGAAVATIDQADLSAHEDGQTRPDPVVLTRRPDAELPGECTVTAQDPEHDYEESTQRASRRQGWAVASNAVSTAVVLSVDESKSLAERLLWRAWAERTTARIVLSDRHLFLNPGDCFHVELGGAYRRFRLARKLRGANGVTEADLVADDPSVYDQDATGSSGAAKPDNSLRLVGVTVAALLDLPLLLDADDAAGLPFYVAVTGPERGWRGVTLYRSTDGGLTYQPVLAESREAVIGTVSGTFAAGPVALWDRTTVVTVVLADGEASLSSRTEAELITSTLNSAAIGLEVVQFATATLVAPQTYELSTFLRGRLGTEDQVAGHAPDERFVLLTQGTVRRLDFGLAELNTTRLYKPVSTPLEPADTLAQSFSLTGRSKRPLAPALPRGVRDAGTGDWALSWQPRTRRAGGFWSGGANPMGEETEAYEIDVMSGATVKRTLAVTAPAASYTAAQQTADFGSPQTTLSLRLHQMSASVGRGIARAATLA